MNCRKALALNFIFILVIAIVGIALLLILIGGPIHQFTQGIFCYFYQKILGQTSESCEQIIEGPEKVRICESKRSDCDVAVKDTEELMRTIAAYSIICWKEKRLVVTNTTLCNMIMLDTHPGNITENALTKLMEQEGGCDILENSKVVNTEGDVVDYPGNCGTYDNIVWNVSYNVIYNQKLITIKYDTDLNKIVIKA